MSDEIVVRSKAVSGTIVKEYLPRFTPGTIDVPDMLRELARLIEKGDVRGTITCIEEMASDHPFTTLTIEVAPKI